VVDPGHYYAPSACDDGKGRRLLWGWVNGFPAGKGWRHCLTMPRVLSVGSEGELLQSPAPELEALRGAPIELADGKPQPLEGRAAEVEMETAKGGVRFGKVEVAVADGKLSVAGKSVDLPAGATTLRIFWDRTLLEVYAGKGRLAMSRVIPLPDATIECFGGAARAWPLHSAWR
jgi:beta-fructofuranosidase